MAMALQTPLQEFGAFCSHSCPCHHAKLHLGQIAGNFYLSTQQLMVFV